MERAVALDRPRGVEQVKVKEEGGVRANKIQEFSFCLWRLQIFLTLQLLLLLMLCEKSLNAIVASAHTHESIER